MRIPRLIPEVMTVGRLYDIIDQNSDDETPLAFYSKKWPGFYIDETTPCRVICGGGRGGDMVSLSVSIDVNPRKMSVLYKSDLLRALEELVRDGASWDAPIEYFNIPNIDSNKSDPSIDSNSSRWDLYPDERGINVFWLSNNIEGFTGIFPRTFPGL